MSLAFSNRFTFQIHSCTKDESDCNNNNEINTIAQATGIFPALMLPEITPSSHSNRKPGWESWGGEEEKKNNQKTKTEKVCFDRGRNTRFHKPPLNSTPCQVEAIGFLAFFFSAHFLPPLSPPPPPISMNSLTVKADNLLLIAATPSRPTREDNHIPAKFAVIRKWQFPKLSYIHT